MSLSLILPFYKELPRLEQTLSAIMAFKEAEKELQLEVLFVNDGSPDTSADFIKQWIKEKQIDYIHVIGYEKNQGKGNAVKVGMLAAKNRLLLMSDTDLSTPLAEWRKLKAAIDAGAAVACGSRALQDSFIGKQPPWHRRILSRLFNILVYLAGVRNFNDTQCGFKMFTAEAAQAIFSRMRTKRFAFDVELIVMARDLGYRVEEIAVHWDYSGHSTVKVFSSGSRMLYDITKLAIRRLFLGKYR